MRNSYTMSESLKNIISLFYTKIFFKKARLIRLPFYIRGKKKFKFGEGLTTGYNCRFEMFGEYDGENKKIIIGKNCKIGDYVHIAAGEKVTIGDNCLFASKIYVSDISHGDYSDRKTASNPDIPPDERVLVVKPVVIGNNVWLGDNVSVLPGVVIGNGCVIGANAVVNSSIPDNCIAVGVPAKIIKKYDEVTKVWKKVP